MTINGTRPFTYTSATTLSFAVTPGQISERHGAGGQSKRHNVGGGSQQRPTTIKVLDPAGDDDGDGMNNSAEDVAGTNPLSSNSLLRITAVVRATSTTLSVTWDSIAGKGYQLESAPTPGGSYTSVGSPLTATGSSTSETVAASASAFYRVRVLP